MPKRRRVLERPDYAASGPVFTVMSPMRTSTKLPRSIQWRAIALAAVISAAPFTMSVTASRPTVAVSAAMARGGGMGGGMGGGFGGGFGGSMGSSGGMSGAAGMSGGAMGPGGQAMGPSTVVHTSMHPGGFIADELVVATDGADALDRLANEGYAVIDQHPLGSLGMTVVRLRIPLNLGPEAALARLREADPSLLADVNSAYQPQGQMALPSPSYPHRLIGWSDNDCGIGQRLGMIDTAIEPDIPALADRKIVQRVFLSQGSRAAPADHGTAIADLLVGQTTTDGPPGLLPRATLYAAAVFEEGADVQPQGSVVNLVSALDWLVSQDVSVINLSLAGDANRLLEIGISKVLSKHVLIVAAAGNGGPDGRPAYPAAYAGVLAATAVDDNRQPYAQATHGDYVAFAAPGVQVWASTAQGAQYFTGTSFATPFLSAAVAVELRDGAPGDPAVVEGRLARSAVSLGPPGRSTAFGWGLLHSTSGCGDPSASLPK